MTETGGFRAFSGIPVECVNPRLQSVIAAARIFGSRQSITVREEEKREKKKKNAHVGALSGVISEFYRGVIVGGILPPGCGFCAGARGNCAHCAPGRCAYTVGVTRRCDRRCVRAALSPVSGIFLYFYRFDRNEFEFDEDAEDREERFFYIESKSFFADYYVYRIHVSCFVSTGFFVLLAKPCNILTTSESFVCASDFIEQ